jgi:hypothetical protein
MSEVNQTNQNADDSTLVEVIMPSAIVEIKMSTGYYQKIQAIVAFLVQGKTAEQMQNAHAQIKDQNVTEDWISHYETILILCREFETKAGEQGFIQKVSLDEAKKLIGESEED